MKRHLTIHIDANRITCGKCQWLETDIASGVQFCRLYNGEWVSVDGREPQRCAPCLAAEREAGE